MSTTIIRDNFSTLPITIDRRVIEGIESLCVHFALRKTHPLTLGGPYLAVNPIAFTTADRNAFFSLFGVTERDVSNVIKACHGAIDRTRAVTSDPFNLLSVWVMHLATQQIDDPKIRYSFMMNVCRYYHYKLFCSVVNNSFRNGANEGVMVATINSLTKKSDIVRLESWQSLIDSRCEATVGPDSRFMPILSNASPDEMVLRVVSDTQSSIRAKIVLIARAYYEVHAKGEKVGFTSSIGEDADGEKIIAQTASVVESVTANMISNVLNPNVFVDETSVEDIAALFTTISPRMLKRALVSMVETAVLQQSSRKFDLVKQDGPRTIYIGIRALMIEIIRSSIRLCRIKRVDMGSKAQCYDVLKNIYSSSRNQEKDVLDIKESVSRFVEDLNATTNEPSKAALRLAIIYYILFRMLMKMK